MICVGDWQDATIAAVQITAQRVALGLEAGLLEPQPHSSICANNCDLGYVVVPMEEAQRYGLPAIQYPASGYADDVT